jgi:predicted O-methyltransferase YrrM
VHKSNLETRRAFEWMRRTYELIEVYRQVAHRVRVGGLLITDNALRRGRVADPAVRADAEIDAVREFNSLMSRDPRFQTTVLPLRDGVTVALRVRA